MAEEPTHPLSVGDVSPQNEKLPPPNVPISATKPSIQKEHNLQQTVLKLAPLLILTGTAVIWSFQAIIPIEVEGRSVLITPRSDIEVQSRASGKILTVNVRSGDSIRKGQLLLTLDLPDLQEELRTKQQKLALLQGENQTITTTQNQRTQLKRETLKRQDESILREIESLQRQSKANLMQIQSNQLQLKANRRQRQAYQQRVEQLKAINELIKERLESFKKLVDEGAVASLSPDLIRAIQAEQENQNTITTLSAQIEDTYASDKNLQATNNSLKAQNEGLQANIKNENANLEDLKTQNRQLDLENVEADVSRENAITDIERDIANLKVKIATDSRVISTIDGQILDLAVNPSQFIEAGTRVATIQVSTQSQALGLNFFKVGDADRIQPGMELEITPDIHQRERYGGIVATVTSVSQETITPQEVASLVGNEQLAESITNEQPVVQIIAELQRDPGTISGYRWTNGKGAPQKIPESATATARVVVEKRSLISYIEPALRRISGIYNR